MDQESFRYRQVERAILDMVESGALSPGDKVPSLRRMSSRMGVGIATVNHAYLELERKGVVESRPRSGFYVSQGRGGLTMPVPEPAMSAPVETHAVSRGKLINTVLESVGSKDILPFWVVCPDQRLLPVKALSRIMISVLRGDDGRSLAYETIPGNACLRRQLAHRSTKNGMATGPDELIITGGAMEALYISLRTLTRPGDTVLIQSPTYYCFLQLLETLGLRAIEIGSDPDTGITAAQVREAIDKFDVNVCVFAGNYNNPDGSLIPAGAKREIVELLADRSIPLVEDDVAGDLHFDPNRPETFKSFDKQGLVLHCSSFSKTVAPGWRIGWMSPGRFREKALEIKATTNVSSAAPTQIAMAEYLATGHYERHLRRLRETVRTNMQAMRHHISQSFPTGTRVTRPRGGYVLWVELPRHVDSVDLFYRARDNGIGINPGVIFSTREKFNHFIRMSCGVVWSPEIVDGIERLGRLIG